MKTLTFPSALIVVVLLLLIATTGRSQNNPQAYEMSTEVQTFVSNTPNHLNKQVGYYLFKPLDQSSNYLFGTAAAPLIVSLHGLGYRANGDFVDANSLKKLHNSYGGDAMAMYVLSEAEGAEGEGLNVPAVVISPQQPGKNNTISNWNAALIDEYIEHVKTIVSIDTDRIYLIGLSMGGGGVWSYLSNPAYGNKIAAAVPMAGTKGSELSSQADEEGYQYTNIWAFHAKGDRVVGDKHTTDMINAINLANGGTPPVGIELKATITGYALHGDLDDMILSSNGDPNEFPANRYEASDNSNLEITNTEYNVPVENAAVDDTPPGIPGVLAWLLSKTLISPGTVVPPSTLVLSSTTIAENNALNDVVGTFSSNGTAPTYQLIETATFPDNNSFSITGNTLRVTTVLDYETKSTYTIKVLAFNAKGNFEKSFTINVEDVNEGAASDIWLEAECATVGANWQIQSDAQATSGQYAVYPSGLSLSSPPSSLADQLVYSFEVSQSGSYSLRARIKAPDLASNSLWVKIDNQPWIKWWEGIAVGGQFAWNQAPGNPFTLSSGNHTLTVAYREAGTQLDKFQLSTSSNLPTGQGGTAPSCNTPPPLNLWLEAECGSVGSNWLTETNTDASNGKYLVYPRGSVNRNPPSGNSDDQVTFTVNVPQAGSYFLLARIRAIDNARNSFWIKIDNQSWIEWWEGMTLSQSFAWNLAPGGAFALSAGSHTISFAYREGGTQLDKLVLNTNSDLPTGQGGSAGNCNNARTASATKARPAAEEVSEFAHSTLSAYPNPANGSITVKLPNGDQQPGVLTLTDISGKVVHRQIVSDAETVSALSIPTEQIGEGMYLLRWQQENKQQTFKLFVNH